MEKINTDYDELEKFRLNFSRCASRDVAPLKNRTLAKNYDYQTSLYLPPKMTDNIKSINHFIEDNFPIRVSFGFRFLFTGYFFIAFKGKLLFS